MSHDVCRVELDAPAPLAVPLGSVLAALWPAFLDRARDAGLPLPAVLPLRAFEASGPIRGETDRSPFGVSVTIRAAATGLRLPALRHAVAHELGHVLAIGASSTGWMGIGGEYVAERLGWELIARAGLWPGREVTVESAEHRLAQRTRAADLARLHDRAERCMPGAFEHRRLRAAFGSCARAIVDAEAYALGAEHALRRPVGLSPLPPGIARLVRASVAPLAADPLPACAAAATLTTYLGSPGSPAALAGMAGMRFAREASGILESTRARLTA